jgi:hypothetical protein
MISFKKIELRDKEWMQGLIATVDIKGCHQSFTNLFVWADIFEHRVARIDDYIVIKGGRSGGPRRYLYPIGVGDIMPVINAMMQDAADCGHRFVVTGLSYDNVKELDAMFPGRFEYKKRRDGFDYVYLLDKLISLSGRKLHAKRNHINYFKENNQWSFEPITADNLAECQRMSDEWYIANDYAKDPGLVDERKVVSRCFRYYSELGLEGGILRSDGRIIAYTMGEILNSDTYVIHIEKAFADIRGAYQMINREFASLIKERYPHIVYVNREDDMGDKGLRKAKLSYYPDRMEEKYIAELKNQ